MAEMMRDLEQIQEERHEEQGSKTAMTVLACVTALSLIVAMGVVMGDGSEGAGFESDPLDALDRSLPIAQQTQLPAQAPPKVDRTTLSFPTALTRDARPEVEAALAAAGIEEEHLDPIPASPLAMALPAAVAAGPDLTMIENTKNDPMLEAAIPSAMAESDKPTAKTGQDGKYTLQVISYRSRPEADTFASALRKRGHESYIEEAEVENRGTFFRVRVGPFKTSNKAHAYRKTFEQEERMNTYVVHKRDDAA